MKRFYPIVALLTIMALLLAACQPATPANHYAAIKAAGTMKVGTSPDYPPFESKDAGGNYVGFDVELMTEIAKRLNLKIEWVDMPFDSLIASVQGGKIDLSISAFNYTEERAQKVDFSAEYYTSEDAFLVTDAFAGQIVNPEDVAAYKVGVQTGTVQDGWLTSELVETGKLPEGNLFRYDRVDQAALDLKAGRIDVLMADSVPAEALVKLQGGMKVVYHGQLATGPMNIVLQKGDKEFADAINGVLTQLKSEGFIDKLALKHFGGM